MTPRSVVIVSYHFHPSPEVGARRPTELARYLVTQGVRVTVVSAFGDRDIEPGTHVLPGVIALPVRRPARTFIGMVVRLKQRLRGPGASAPVRSPFDLSPSATPTAPLSLPVRLRELFFRWACFLDEYKRWGLRAARAIVREGRSRPFGAILSSSPPLSVLWAGTLAARRLGVPHVADLRDPWSDVVADLHPAWQLDLTVQRALERWILRSSAAVTSATAKVAQLLTERQPEIASKTFVVRNGYDGPISSPGLQTGGRLDIFFAGNLYLNRDPFPLLDALERLLSRPEVEAAGVSVTLMGQRSLQTEKALGAWLEGKKCGSCIHLVPPQPPSVVAAATARATVVLNLAQRQPMSVPAKTFEHLASGRENLLLCEDDSETARLVSNIPGVVQVDPRNTEALDRALLDLYDRHVRQRSLRAPAEQDVSGFSRLASNEAFWRIIRAAAGTGTSRAGAVLP